MTMVKDDVICILLGALVCFGGMAFAQENAGIEQEVVIQHQVIELPKKPRSYTKQEIKMLKEAREVVKKYWVSSYEEIYGLFSNDLKEILKRTRKISNAIDYKNSMPVTEREWVKQTYQRAEMQDDKFVKIVVLAEWDDEGYNGVNDFHFRFG